MNIETNQSLKTKFCPNIIINDGNISVGEFQTLQDATEFPLQGIWCVNRENDNKFNAYKSQGTRIFVICSWVRPDTDSLKYVLTLIHTNGKIHYWDMNDLPLYPESKKNQYEGSLGDSVTYELYKIAKSMTKNTENNIKTENNNFYNMKQKIRLTEGDLHRIIRKCVNEALNELGEYGSVNAKDLYGCVIEWGSDPYLIEDMEQAKSMADVINSSTYRGVIYPKDESYERACECLGGDIDGPIYTFVNGSAGSFAKS